MTKNKITKEDFIDTIDIKIGHRKRVKTRFLENYNLNSSYDDYELLEMLLFLAIPRKDVKPLAKLLLSRYGSLGKILASSKESLLKTEGVTENIIFTLILMKATTIQLLRRNLEGTTVIKNWETLLDYCYAHIVDQSKEVIKILYLNTRNVLIKDEIIQEGTLDIINIHPREIIRRCLDIAAKSIIIVHNHPSGNPDPSEEDIKLTTYLVKNLHTANISLYDHIIVGRGGIISFKSLGLLS